MIIDRCPSTLAPGYNTYSPVALKRLFDKQPVSHILSYNNPLSDDSLENVAKFKDNLTRISISGAQPKYSLIVRNGRMELTKEGEQGTFILKPKIIAHANRAFSPANEHLTMQIAEQIFDIETAANALCVFEDDEMAYITRRFDITPDGKKYRKEDCASLAGLTSENAGQYYKYDRLSYEDIAALIKKFVPAWKIELLKYFRLVVFNFLFGNGDAHLKNFSLIETSDGDFRLAPAYDLMNTLIHIPTDPIFALDKGLFKDGDKKHLQMGIISGKVFLEWGKRIGLPEKSVLKELERFCADYSKLEELVVNSYLSDKLKMEYLSLYKTRKESYLRDFG